MEILRDRLTMNQVREMIGNGTRIKVVIPITLGELIGLSLEDLNDLMDERILPEHEDITGGISDIKYKVVGHEEENLGEEYFTSGKVLVEVSGDVEIYEE